MAQSKNRLVLAIKRHALSIHERKTWSARCTRSRETFVQARLERFEHNCIFPRICRYNSRKSGTDVRQIYPLLSVHAKISILCTTLPLFRPRKRQLAHLHSQFTVTTCRSRQIFPSNRWQDLLVNRILQLGHFDENCRSRDTNSCLINISIVLSKIIEIRKSSKEYFKDEMLNVSTNDKY